MTSVIKSAERVHDSRDEQPYVLAGLAYRADEPEASQEPDLGPTPEEIARQIIAEAEQRAQITIDAAACEAARIEQEARQRGLEQGRQEAEERCRAACDVLDAEVQRLREEWTALMEEAEPELARLSVEIARKVLKQEISQNPDAVLTVVRAAMHRVKDKQVRIAVNPEELERVRAARDSFQSIADGVHEMEIVSDRRVGEGGCVIETPGGSMDARIETQLGHIEDILEKACYDGITPRAN